MASSFRLVRAPTRSSSSRGVSSTESLDFVGVFVGVFAAALGFALDFGVPLALGVDAGSGEDPAIVSAIVRVQTMTMTMRDCEV